MSILRVLSVVAAILVGWLGFLAVASAKQPLPGPPPPPPTAPYAGLTDNEVEVTNFMPEPFSGIAVDSDGGVWAINPYASTILRFPNLAATPDVEAFTGHNPVSIGVWEPPGGQAADRKIVVACVGTHAAFLHNAQTGAVEKIVRLGDEPGDLVIDEENARLFVSCQGSNTIAQVDLATFTVQQSYSLPTGQRPGPLYLDRGEPGEEDDNFVYVAATVTGNNSTIRPGAVEEAGGSVQDLALLPASPQLPDEDVFRIDPVAASISPVIKGAGSLLFDIDRNPATTDFWILSSDSNNKDPALDTEAELSGIVAINQLHVIAGVTGGSGLHVAPSIGLDLDALGPGMPPPYDATRSVNQARTMDFVEGEGPDRGTGFVASPLSDVIVVTNTIGKRIGELQLLPRSQCYSVKVLDSDETRLLALCLGTVAHASLPEPMLTLQVFDWASQAGPVAVLPLGRDPTPDQIRRGRDVFLNGKHSRDGRTSCASCHPRGMTDQLGWAIGGEPTDFKDVMLTQSLLSIADSFPHHWRGERDLEAFKKAFQGLLGADPESPLGSVTQEPTDAEMADLVVFMQSLQAPANPLENPRRIVDDARTPDPAPLVGMTGSAVEGQDLFLTVPNFRGFTCAECHPMETGSNGNPFAEGFTSAPRANPIEVAHLRQLQHRGLDTMLTSFDGINDVRVNEGGFGLAHNGRFASLFNFIFDPADFQIAFPDPQERVDIFMFNQQFDQGISPAVHWASWLDASSGIAAKKNIKEILIDGAIAGWNDVVAFGTYNGAPVRWWYDTSGGTPLFKAEDPSVNDRTWAELKADAEAGIASQVIMGMPIGNGRRFAVDPDNDGLATAAELALGSDPDDPDSDGDGWPDGYEVAASPPNDPTVFEATINDTTPPDLVRHELEFTTARIAKYRVEFDEDATYVVDFTLSDGVTTVSDSFERTYISRKDTFVLTHNLPSPLTGNLLTGSVTLRATDRNNNSTNPLTPFVLDSFEPMRTQLDSFTSDFVHVSEMAWIQENSGGGVLDAVVRVTLKENDGAPLFNPAVGLKVFAIVSIRDAAPHSPFVQSGTFTSTLPSQFSILSGGQVDPYTATPGPFLVSANTDAQGQATLDFNQTGLTSGQTVRLSVLGACEPVNAANPFLFLRSELHRTTQLPLEGVAELDHKVP